MGRSTAFVGACLLGLCLAGCEHKTKSTPRPEPEAKVDASKDDRNLDVDAGPVSVDVGDEGIEVNVGDEE